MSDADSYVCLFCSSDIRNSDHTTTVPNLGVLVHSSCYRRDAENGESAPKGRANAA
jgi:hypothetical protein